MKPALGTVKEFVFLGWSASLLCGTMSGSACTQQPARVFSAPSRQAIVLVSLDGFRADYLGRESSTHLRRLASSGVSARWLVPVFPTVTFPNHYSIVTGLYPEHHGIVSNIMWDSLIGRRFAPGDTTAVRDPRWWGGEPIWATAVRQGRRSATFFWPGSEAPIGGVLPTYSTRFDPAVPNSSRVRQVLDWLSLPPAEAPALVTLYFGDVDKAGHAYGPEASQTDSAIARVDSAIGALVSGLEERGLLGRVNLIVVSDHGMAEVSRDRQIYLDDYVDMSTLEVIDWRAMVTIRPRPGYEEEVYRRLHGKHPKLTVYRKEEVPERYHFRAHQRIPAIIALAEEGWSVTTRGAASLTSERFPRGLHGYAPETVSMRALFVASGPAFRKGVVVEPFQSIHLYELMAHILALHPARNDGVLDSVRALLGPALELAR